MTQPDEQAPLPAPERSPWRVVWAVDPSKQAAVFYQSISQVLSFFLRCCNAIIEPTYVLRMAPEVSPEFVTQWLPEYTLAAQDQIEDLLSELKVEGTAPPQIIFRETMTLSEAVDALSDFAQRRGADLIIAQTHSQKALTRLFVGSFAESLLFHSKIPVMLVRQEMKPVAGFQRILFPTDFGSTSFAQFEQALALAERFGASITLYHSVLPPIDLVGDGYPIGSPNFFPDFVRQKIRDAEQNAQAWARIAQAHGVRMDFTVEEELDSTWKQILKAAQEKDVDLIAMEPQSGPISSLILGSTTRQVIRHASCPVLALKSRTAGALRAPRPSTEEKAA